MEIRPLMKFIIDKKKKIYVNDSTSKKDEEYVKTSQKININVNSFDTPQILFEKLYKVLNVDPRNFTIIGKNSDGVNKIPLVFLDDNEDYIIFDISKISPFNDISDIKENFMNYTRKRRYETLQELSDIFEYEIYSLNYYLEKVINNSKFNKNLYKNFIYFFFDLEFENFINLTNKTEYGTLPNEHFKENIDEIYAFEENLFTEKNIPKVHPNIVNYTLKLLIEERQYVLKKIKLPLFRILFDKIRFDEETSFGKLISAFLRF